MDRWNRAKKGELVRRMERAIGGFPRFASLPEMLRQMDEAAADMNSKRRDVDLYEA